MRALREQTHLNQFKRAMSRDCICCRLRSQSRAQFIRGCCCCFFFFHFYSFHFGVPLFSTHFDGSVRWNIYVCIWCGSFHFVSFHFDSSIRCLFYFLFSCCLHELVVRFSFVRTSSNRLILPLTEYRGERESKKLASPHIHRHAGAAAAEKSQ